MLAKRIIPQLLCRGRQLVKGEKFDSWRSVGVVAQAVRVHQWRSVDQVMLLDIGATPEGRGPDLTLIRELAEATFSPLTVGGGIKSVEDVRNLLRCGADQVCVNTAAVENPKLIKEISERFGASTLTVAIDVYPRRGWWYVATNCGKTSQAISVHDWVRHVEYLGAGEILITNIEREGTMQGYDTELIKVVADAVDIPVIAGGGCSGPKDMYKAIKAGASACAAGALFQFTEITPAMCASYLDECGVEVRTCA